jgi:prepilin-type N-terminal cleavage/methylation domain-containing protein
VCGVRFNKTWKDQRGYTMPEVLTAVAISGVLVVVSVIILLALLERWRVEAAADQLASDMRLAHTKAANQLTDWRMVMRTGSPSYRLVKLETVYDDDSTRVPPVVETVDRSLPIGTMVFSSTANAAARNPEAGKEFYVEFNSDGRIHVENGPNGHVKASSGDGSPTIGVTYLSATSRIKVGPVVYP